MMTGMSLEARALLLAGVVVSCASVLEVTNAAGVDVSNADPAATLGFGLGGALRNVALGFLLSLGLGYVLLSVARRDKAPAGYHLPPVYSSPIPLIGNFIGFAKDPLGFVAQGRKQCGEVFTIDMLAETLKVHFSYRCRRPCRVF